VPVAITGDDPISSFGVDYLQAVMVCGFAVTLIFPAEFWPAPLGIFAGQAAFIHFHCPADALNYVPALGFGAPFALLGSLVCYTAVRITREHDFRHRQASTRSQRSTTSPAVPPRCSAIRARWVR